MTPAREMQKGLREAHQRLLRVISMMERELDGPVESATRDCINDLRVRLQVSDDLVTGVEDAVPEVFHWMDEES